MNKVRRHHKVIITPQAKVLRSLREKRKLSTRQVAESLGLSASYISQIENGRTNFPSGERMLKLLALYGIKPKYFSQLVKEWNDAPNELMIASKLLSSLDEQGLQIASRIIGLLASKKIDSKQAELLETMLSHFS